MLYYFLIALAIFSIAYINVNNTRIAKTRYNQEWERNKIKYQFGIDYSDKPSVVYSNMFNDDNRYNTYDDHIDPNVPRTEFSKRLI